MTENTHHEPAAGDTAGTPQAIAEAEAVSRGDAALRRALAGPGPSGWAHPASVSETLAAQEAGYGAGLAGDTPAACPHTGPADRARFLRIHWSQGWAAGRVDRARDLHHALTDAEHLGRP